MTRNHFDDELLERSRLLICLGTGGVGKTTTSAALALRAAQRGRKVLVLTIDPARRLADAMGLQHLSNEPTPVDLSALGETAGTLDATMLDAKATFDDLVRRVAGSKADLIIDNRIYRDFSAHLTGTQEYMALERIYETYEAGRWDLVIVDTPPAKNAFDFFAAPGRASAMFDERIVRWFLPSEVADRGILTRFLHPGNVVLKLLGYIAGQEFVEELSEFFGALSVASGAFRERGDRVREILGDAATRYVLITTAEPRRVEEAVEVIDKLDDSGRRIDAVVVNRSFSRFEDVSLSALDDTAALGEQAKARLRPLFEQLVALGKRDRDGTARLAASVPGGQLATLPAIAGDIHSLPALSALSERLVDSLRDGSG